MPKITVTKMQGCGNDFVFMEYEEFLKTGLTLKELSKRICDRHFGIGGDGLIIPILNSGADADIKWHYYNSDGTTAQMCGNGMRCFARYVYDKGLVSSRKFSVKTLAGIIRPEILDNGNIRVNMGSPVLTDEKIPFSGERELNIDGNCYSITPVSMGNPHCVIFMDKDTMILAREIGPRIENHPYFPEKTNVEFVRIISKDEIEMGVYERGCGITLACGTGACASVVACILNNLTEHNVKVNLPGGTVIVEWQGSSNDTERNVYLIGSAQYVFNAKYML